MSKQIKKLGDLEKNPELDESTKLDELFDKPLTINGFKVIQVGANPFAIIETEEHGKVSSSSKVILDQLDKMKPDLEQGDIFKVTAIKKKNYYMFIDR